MTKPPRLCPIMMSGRCLSCVKIEHIHGGGIHMKETYTWKGHTHGRDVYMEGSYNGENIHTEKTYKIDIQTIQK